ncbi:MAG: hypothetical protein IJS94_08145, partial [Clostridia bacterium]|nr:hypothetical protein [Clostridia bacterium]
DAAVDAAGLTLEIGENPAIALQDEGSITIDLFSHEFIHLLEKKVYYELLNDWEKLSPDGSYFMSYENYYSRQGASDYTCYGNKGKVYFIDSYSRTFPTEDRARVGEYLYSSYKEGKLVWQFKENKYIRRKAVKLCEILRETYPCLDSIPKGEWYLEKFLGIN